MTSVRFFTRYLPFWLSIGLFAVSLANDGFYIEGPDPRAWAPGYGLLLLGWAGMFAGTVAWAANPVLLLAWMSFYFGWYRRSAVFALVAAALMLSFLFAKTVVTSEAPTVSAIIGYGTGYWLWLSSALLLLITSIVNAATAVKLKATTSAP